MKSKLLSILLITILIITACNGQSGNNPAETRETETAVNTENNYGNLEFDFYEAMQNIYLFGNKISLPTTLNDMGEDFSLDENIIIPTTDNVNTVIVPLLYKNETIGTATLQDCDSNEKNKSSKLIMNLALGSIVKEELDYWYKEVIQVDFLGISFNSTEEEVKRILGIPTFSEESFDGLFYDYEKYLVYEFSEYERVEILFRDSKIKEFNFRLKYVGN